MRPHRTNEVCKPKKHKKNVKSVRDDEDDEVVGLEIGFNESAFVLVRLLFGSVSGRSGSSWVVVVVVVDSDDEDFWVMSLGFTFPYV